MKRKNYLKEDTQELGLINWTEFGLPYVIASNKDKTSTKLCPTSQSELDPANIISLNLEKTISLLQCSPRFVCPKLEVKLKRKENIDNWNIDYEIETIMTEKMYRQIIKEPTNLVYTKRNYLLVELNRIPKEIIDIIAEYCIEEITGYATLCIKRSFWSSDSYYFSLQDNGILLKFHNKYCTEKCNGEISKNIYIYKYFEIITNNLNNNGKEYKLLNTNCVSIRTTRILEEYLDIKKNGINSNIRIVQKDTLLLVNFPEINLDYFNEMKIIAVDNFSDMYLYFIRKTPEVERLFCIALAIINNFSEEKDLIYS